MHGAKKPGFEMATKPKPRRYGVKTRRINVTVTQQDADTLKAIGGASEGIRVLCEQHRQQGQAKEPQQ